MPVHGEDLLVSLLVTQQHRLFDFRAVEQRLDVSGDIVEPQIKVLADELRISQLHIVIAVNADIAVFDMELTKKAENLRVGFEDVMEL